MLEVKVKKMFGFNDEKEVQVGKKHAYITNGQVISLCHRTK
jgi:hypothetical protein